METKDRHREGYYKEYAEQTGKKNTIPQITTRNTVSARS